MTGPMTPRRNPMRVAIIVLAVAVVAIAAIVVFLLWGRDTQTALPTPAPSPSASPVAEPSPSRSASHVQSTTTSASPQPSTATPAPSPITPVGTETASPQPSMTSPGTPTARQTMMWEGMASFDNITVELLQEDEGQSTAMIDGKAGFLVEVCLMKDVDGGEGAPITSSSWTLEDSDGNVQSPQKAATLRPCPPIQSWRWVNAPRASSPLTTSQQTATTPTSSTTTTSATGRSGSSTDSACRHHLCEVLER